MLKSRRRLAGQTPPCLDSSTTHYIDPSLFDIQPVAMPRPIPRRLPLLLAAALCLTALCLVAVLFMGRSTPSGDSSDGNGVIPPVSGESTTPSEPFDESDPASTTATLIDDTTHASPFSTTSPAVTTKTPVESTGLAEPMTTRPTEPETSSETAAPDTTGPDVTTAQPSTPATPPPGTYPITADDMSEIARGMAALTGQTAALPPVLPTVTFTADPVVLIVHSAPTQGYNDGTPWYDPATGPLGVVAVNDPAGVTAQGAALTAALEAEGVKTIHLTVPPTLESTQDAYAATDALVREYCRLYPRIALVLDLRRTAELTSGGHILQTVGQYEGNTTAQLRISVSRDRATAALSRDLTLALSLRRILWNMEPSISRPVHLRSGVGLGGGDSSMDHIPVLTLDLGSAGNTTAEAACLVAPLARALATMLSPA